MVIPSIRNTEDLELSFRETVSTLEKIDPSNVDRVNVLLSQPRTGSTLVCDYLTKAQDLGWCDEWINPILVTEIKKSLGCQSLKEAVSWIASRAASPTGVFTVNIQIPHLLHWRKNKESVDLQYDRLIYLSRQNKLEQALSYARALKSKRFVQLSENSDSRPVFVSNVELAASVHRVSTYDDFAQKLLIDADVLKISYEDIASHAGAQIDRILDYFGSQSQFAELPTSNIVKQSDNAADARLSDFLNYLRGGEA